MQWSNFSPRSAAQFSSFGVPLTAMPSSSPVIRNEIEPFGLPPLRAEMVEHGGERAGDAAFHVDRAAAVQLAAGDLAGKWRMRPGLLVARRHHVGMAGEHQMRRSRADARVEVLDVVGAGLAERHAVHGEAGRLQRLFEKGERAAFRRRDRRAAQQIAGDGDGIGGHRLAFASQSLKQFVDAGLRARASRRRA